MPVSSNNFIDINSDFFSKVKNRYSDKNTGELIDPQIVERLAHPTCIECQEGYKKKFPNRPFHIKCDGIRSEEHYEQIAEEMSDTVDNVKELLDCSVWAEKYLVVKNSKGEIVPMVPRSYQKKMLQCTAKFKVDRMGRGTGKTQTGVAEELWYIMTKPNFNTLVLCPAQAQSEMWFKELQFQLTYSPTLNSASVKVKQQPFYQFKFTNGSSIFIFTAGSKSGKGADSIRGQSPDRVRLDEQDYLNENDWDAIDPLFTRKKHVTFHGSSTPTGMRGKFWRMCTQFDDHKEFYYPISVHPDWNTEMEETCIRNAKTADRYRHEYLAEFGEPSSGVFKSTFVDNAIKPYKYSNQLYDPSKRYFLGVDWNGKGTGTRICVVEYDPESRLRRKVATRAVDSEGSTTSDSIGAIIKMNRDWCCEEAFIDAGFGFAQDEMIKLAGKAAGQSDPYTARLKYAKSVNFGGSLEFNTLVPNRDSGGKKVPGNDDQLKRRTKPFMVEGCVMAFEMGLVEISAADTLLEEQLRAYKVSTWSRDDAANTYETNSEIGDHDLDAFMLAMLAIELKYGLMHTPDTIRRIASFAYAGGFGLSSSQGSNIEVAKDNLRSQNMMTSRTPKDATKQNNDSRILYLLRNGAITAPNQSGGGKMLRVPSRTSMFSSSGTRGKI